MREDRERNKGSGVRPCRKEKVHVGAGHAGPRRPG